MTTILKISGYDIEAKPCILNEDKTKVEKITAVDLRNSKYLKSLINDTGLIVYNEDNYGFFVSWKEFEVIEQGPNISEDNYEKILSDFNFIFIKMVVNHINRYNH